MDDHAGSLVEDDQVRILVDHPQGKILGHDSRGLGRGNLDLDPLRAPQPARRLGGASVDPDETGGHELLDPGAR
jgi:hypothetical protein